MPNFVLFMSDEHNPKISSVYGHPFVRTPNMERLAAMGTVYRNAYCPSPLCVPSRSALMAGRHVHEIRAFNNCKVIPADHPSYGGVMAEQGVHTTWVGSHSNLYKDPFELGFSEMLLVERQRLNLSTEFDRRPLPKRRPGALKPEYGPRDDAWASSIRQVDRAVEWLLETAPKLDVPWTLTVNVHPPHPPLWALPEYWAMYDGLADLPQHGPDEASAKHPYAMSLREYYATDECSPEQAMGMRQGYYASVTYVDHELGRVLDALERAGLTKDTVVAYTADHGEMLGKFGMWWKSSMYEDSVRIPMIAAGPGFEKGEQVETPVSLLDLQASIFHAVGAKRPSHWHGEPLQEIPNEDPSRVVFSQYHGHGVPSGAFMVRQGDWKLIYNMAAPHQLFNLRTDPEELENLWDREPEMADNLEKALREICNPEKVNQEAHEHEARQLATIEAIKAANDAR